jgi:hypothetical protein
MYVKFARNILIFMDFFATHTHARERARAHTHTRARTDMQLFVLGVEWIFPES